MAVQVQFCWIELQQ